MSEQEQKEEPALTLSQRELVDFITALRETLLQSITENNQQAMDAVFQSVFPPFLERMDQIAQAQITLAMALKTNRRDMNAHEFAKLLIARAMTTPEGIDKSALHVIPAEAYALADEMDLHGRVAEMQAEAKGERMDEAVAKVRAGHADPATLVNSFFGRRPEPTETPPRKHPEKFKKH